jgi:hypothetical protein
MAQASELLERRRFAENVVRGSQEGNTKQSPYPTVAQAELHAEADGMVVFPCCTPLACYR